MQQFGQITRRMSGWVMLCLALAVAGCSLTDQTPVYRYRLTVEVDTPDGVKTGLSVIEVDTEVAGGYSIPTPGRVTNRVRGEAVTVDLGEGRVLFALLRSEADIDWAGRVMYRLSPQYAGENALRDGYRNMLRHRPERTVPRHFSRADQVNKRSAYPMLVTFGDLDDPTSVERVDPDDLAATFGEGVSLKRITVQVTDDPVTSGIGQRLGWLESSVGSIVKQPRGVPIGDMPIEQRVNKGDFRRKGMQ